MCLQSVLHSSSFPVCSDSPSSSSSSTISSLSSASSSAGSSGSSSGSSSICSSRGTFKLSLSMRSILSP